MTRSVTYLDYQIKVYQEGSGKPLVFLHGWPTNSRLWHSQVEALKADYKVITYDCLGFGQSDKPKEHSYTFTKKKEILDAVLADTLDDNETVTLIAHDIGGPPAILWAHDNQEQVERLVLLNTILFPFSTPLDKISHFSFGIPLLNRLLVSDFYLKNVMKKFTKSKGEIVDRHIGSILDWHQNLTSRTKLRTILEPMNQGRANELLSLEAKLQQLPAKKFLIIAKEDPLCYAHMKRFCERNPSVPSFIIDNCGHYLPIDKPKELTNILLKILKEDVVGQGHKAQYDSSL